MLRIFRFYYIRISQALYLQVLLTFENKRFETGGPLKLEVHISNTSVEVPDVFRSSLNLNNRK